MLLNAVDRIAKKHSVPISAIAIRHSLDQPGVSAVIIGSRLNPSSTKYTDASLATFTISLDEDDRREITRAQEGLKDIPGDCGDEYRRPPYLTAAGDLSDHLADDSERLERVSEVVGKGGRVEYSSGSVWEPVAVRALSRSSSNLTSQGYCRDRPLRQHHHRLGDDRDLPPELARHRRDLPRGPDHTHLRHHHRLPVRARFVVA